MIIRTFFVFVFVFLLLWLSLAGLAEADGPTRYLAFQIFTPAADSVDIGRALPPQPDDLDGVVKELSQRIGTTGTGGRKLGFVLGPLSLDHTDEAVVALVARGFEMALATNVAVVFHVDDSMFWRRRVNLNQPDDIEWSDWEGTANTGRRLD